MAVAMSGAAPTAARAHRVEMLIDGSWVSSASGDWIGVESPGNRRVFASIPRGNAADVDRAVKAATQAFPGWSKVAPKRAEATS